MAKVGLTPKQEKFTLAYVETGNASEAYRRAYNSEKMKPETIKSKACLLLKQGNVAATVAELKAVHSERHNITVDTITAMLREDRDFARGLEAPAPAVSASMGLAKLHGLLTDKSEVTIKLTEEAASWLGR